MSIDGENLISEAASEPERSGTSSHQSILTEAVDLVKRSKQVTGTYKHFVNGGLLATSVAVLFAIAGLQASGSDHRLDAPLTLAVRACAISIPFLIQGIVSASMVFAPRSEAEVFAAKTWAWVGAVAETVGLWAVFVGFGAFVWHVDAVAGALLLVGGAGVYLTIPVVGAVGGVIERSRRKRGEGETTSDDRRSGSEPLATL
jgi:hypothetical protein